MLETVSVPPSESVLSARDPLYSMFHLGREIHSIQIKHVLSANLPAYTHKSTSHPEPEPLGPGPFPFRLR